jgi:hypothetical protein
MNRAESARELRRGIWNASRRRQALVPCNTGVIGSLMIAPENRAAIDCSVAVIN